MTSAGRIRALLRARLRSGPPGSSPIATLVPLALISGFFCALVGDVLSPFAYALAVFSLSAASVAIPLLGELGWLLRRDPSEEWVGSLPVRAFEIRLARTLHLMALLGTLALASLVPASLFLPAAAPTHAVITLPLLGLGLVVLLAGVLLFLQNLFGERAEGLLIGLQTLLVGAVALGVLLGIRMLPRLARLEPDAALGGLLCLPSTWFALPFRGASVWPALASSGLGLALLVLLPPTAAPRVAGRPWLAVLLAPLRSLANRLWVRPAERGIFDLVYDALPREREVVLRTVPMIGIPLAMLALSTSDDPRGRADLLSLLLFTAPIYLPIVLTQVPTTTSPGAAWLHRTAPVSERTVAEGTIKALALRFLVPLYVLLGGVAWVRTDLATAVRLGLPAFFVALLVLRRLHGLCVTAPPLSVPPEETRFDQDWLGALGGVAVLLTLLALGMSRIVPLGVSLALAGLLGLCEALLERRAAQDEEPLRQASHRKG